MSDTYPCVIPDCRGCEYCIGEERFVARVEAKQREWENALAPVLSILGEGCEPYEITPEALDWVAWRDDRREHPIRHFFGRLFRRPWAQEPPTPTWKIRHDYGTAPLP